MSLLALLLLLQAPPPPAAPARSLEIATWWIAPESPDGKPLPEELKSAPGLKGRLAPGSQLRSFASVRVSPAARQPASVSLALTLGSSSTVIFDCLVAQAAKTVTLTELDVRDRKGEQSLFLCQVDRVELSPGEPTVLASWDGQLLVARVAVSGPEAPVKPPPKEPFDWKGWKITRISATGDSDQYTVDPAENGEMSTEMSTVLDALLKGCRIDKEAAQGLRLAEVPAGCLASGFGLMDGDVIKSLNGQPIADAEAFDTLLTEPAVRRATAYTFGIQRGGQVRALVIRKAAARK